MTVLELRGLDTLLAELTVEARKAGRGERLVEAVEVARAFALVLADKKEGTE